MYAHAKRDVTGVHTCNHVTPHHVIICIHICIHILPRCLHVQAYVDMLLACCWYVFTCVRPFIDRDS